MRLIFLVEEQSMKELLEALLPKILPEGVEKLIVPHSGKSDLARSIPIKLRGWRNPDDKFVIVHDQDNNDCITLKDELLALCRNGRNECLVRIACRELEAWYFGDLDAVSAAYGKNFAKLKNKQKYREPDKLGNAKEELRKLIPTHRQILGAQLIGANMDTNRNTSHSFKVFVNGVKSIAV